MKKLIPMLLLWSSGLGALAQGVVVVPNGFANVEGNSSTSDPFTSSSFRLQMVIDASQFAIPPGASGRINSISFRIDGASSGNVAYSFDGGSLTASTTTRAPDGLSSVFADNVGANPVTVFSGAVAFGNFRLAGANPQPFGSRILATTPFWYQPSQGNLLIDIAGAGGFTIFPGALDAQLASGDSVSRVFATSDLSEFGTVDTLGLVTRFDLTIVPEPSTCALAVLGLLLGAALWRKK